MCAPVELSLPAWRALAKQISSTHSLTALRKALRLFRTAAHSNDDDKPGADSSSLHLASSPLYRAVIQFALTSIPATFLHHLQPTHKGALASHPRFKVLGPLLKSYLSSYVHLLSSLQDPPLVRVMLSTLLETLLPLLDPFHKLCQRLLRQLLVLWSTQDRSTRIDAFLVIRQMALSLGRHEVLEEAMKGLYLTYVQYAKWVTPHSEGVLEFMANCVTELYCMDLTLAYQHAFVYIRQLAIHLRNASHNAKGTAGGGKAGGAGDKGGKKKGGGGREGEGYRLVYNWQYINCLRVWTKVLSSPLACHPVSGASPPAGTLRPLLYPFVQVCLGVMGLLPSSRYHPLRLIVASYLLTLSSACHLFIPVLPSLLSVFSAAELTRRPSAATSKAPDLRYLLRASKTTVASRGYQEALCTQALRLITRYCTAHSYALAYCELVLPAVRFLRRWVKHSKIQRLKKEIGAVITQLEFNAEWSRKRREASEWTPKDALEGRVDAMLAFKGVGEEGGKDAISPLERYANMERGERGEGEVAEEDMDWDGSRSRGKRRGKSEDDDDEDGDEEEEEEVDGEEEDEDDEADDGEVMMDDEEDEDEEEEEVERKPALASRKTAKQKAPPAAAKKQQDGSALSRARAAILKKRRVEEADIAGSGEDIVTELVLSDEDG